MRKLLKIALFLGLMLIEPSYVLAKPPENYNQAKQAARMIWNEQRATFYCGCHYNKQGYINFKSCSYQPVNKRRDQKIEWEHVVPVSWYGRGRDCWQKNYCQDGQKKSPRGRKCCQRTDPEFVAMESDLHNLVPIERDVNRARSHFPFIELGLDTSDKSLNYRGCPVVIDQSTGYALPPQGRKGWIARINLYMIKKYGITVSKDLIKTYQSWDKQFPPTEQEIAWRKRVEAVMNEE